MDVKELGVLRLNGTGIARSHDKICHSVPPVEFFIIDHKLPRDAVQRAHFEEEAPATSSWKISNLCLPSAETA